MYYRKYRSPMSSLALLWAQTDIKDNAAVILTLNLVMIVCSCPLAKFGVP